MSHFYIELKESIMKKKIFSLFIFLLSCALFMLVSSLYLSWVSVDLKTKSFYAQYQDQNVYKLSDELIGEREKEFFENPKEIAILKSFYNELNNEKDFIYLGIQSQPVSIKDFVSEEKFLEGYEENEIYPKYEDDEGTFSTVKSIQVNKKAVENFHFILEEGSLFADEDYYYNLERKIPLILGKEYQSEYSIGDKIYLNYLYENFEGEVIGILDNNNAFPLQNEMGIYLDRSIIFPEFIINQEPLNQEFLAFQQKHYLDAINGHILTKLDKLKVREKLDRISTKTNFSDFQVIGANDKGIDIMMSMLKQNSKIIISLSVLLVIFSIVSIAASLLMKWNINIKKYTIHLIFGASVRKLLLYTFFELLLILLSALAIIFIYMTTIGSLPYSYYILMLLLVPIIVLLGLVPFYMKLKKLNFTEMSKRNG